jgi:hypothetical protein
LLIQIVNKTKNTLPKYELGSHVGSAGYSLSDIIDNHAYFANLSPLINALIIEQRLCSG